MNVQIDFACMVSALVCLQHDEGTVEIEDNLHIHSYLAAPTHLRPRTHSDQPILMHYLTLVRKERDERYVTCGGGGRGGGEEGAVQAK